MPLGLHHLQLLHLRLVAPLDTRVARLRSRFGWDASTAAAKARHMDDDRRRYVQRYFHRDVLDPLLYDVQINTGRTTIAEAVTMIERLVRSHAADETSMAESREQGASAIA